jgi:ankyrin repeat protein
MKRKPTEDQQELLDAALDNDTAKALSLLRRGVSPDFEDAIYGSPLEAAVKHDNRTLLRALDRHGADLDRVGGFHETTLDYAERLGRRKIVKYLEQRGAKSGDAHHLSRPQKALMKAVAAGKPTRVRRLLSGGMSADFADDLATTPLEEAVYGGDLDIVKQLVAAGADVNRRDISGDTPLDLARGRHEDAIAAFLKSSGARSSRSLNAQGSGRRGNKPHGSGLVEDFGEEFFDDSKYYFGADEGYRPQRGGEKPHVSQQRPLRESFDPAALAAVKRETLKSARPTNFKLHSRPPKAPPAV